MQPTDAAAALLGLDHVVIAVADLDQAITDYRALGFTVVPGGRHPGRTSHNALVVFDDGAYLELIAWLAPAPEERWWRVLTSHGDGFVDFALRPRDTAAALQAARARGLDTLTGPVDGGRIRPDGAQLQWRTARHDTPDVPFLCGDITPRDLRVPDGDVRHHANGALGVAALTVAVEDLATTLARYSALLGTQGVFETAVVGGDQAERSHFVLGPTRYTLVAPSPQAPASHPLRQRLVLRGPGVIDLVLTAMPGSQPAALPPQGTHGATISIVAAAPRHAPR